MSKTPNYDAKVKAILGALQPGERTCEMTGEKWVMDEEEIDVFKQFNVPPSPYSRQVRLWHTLSFGTVYQWWWNKNFDTGEPILTYAHPASGIRALPDKDWFDRDFADTSLELDVSKLFFDQLRDLQVKIPVNATRNIVPPENSIATTSMGDKNSYFVAASTSKDCLYLNDCQDADHSIDCNAGISITECYRVNHSSRLHRCFFILESYDCQESAFLFDCRNCEYCFGATNKRNKKYIWFNEQLTKEEWEKKRAELDLGSRDVLEATEKRFTDLVQNKAVWPENFNVRTADSTGEYLIECTNCVHTSYGLKSQNNYWCYGVYNGDGNAYCIAIPGQNNYQSGMVGETANSKFSTSLIRCDDCEYSINCYDSEHCFGCVGLRHKRFHIFNKPYSEEEYWKKVDELKCAMLDRGEYGRPIPISMSFSYYPESGAYLYLGASMSDWDVMGMKQFDIDADGAFGALRMEGKEILQPDQVPVNVDDLDDSWVGRAILDTEIKRPFTLMKPEIAFYKKHRIAPPRQHFTARIRDLMWQMNTGLFEDVDCVKCSKQVMVATNRTFTNRKIYCNDCYLNYLETNG